MTSLPDELVEEVFLRLPPDEPAALVRASLVSKPWFGLLTGPAFRGRYREFHGAPPMLGFLYNRPYGYSRRKDLTPLFVSTTKFRVRIPHFTQRTHQSLDAWDCRHGMVLLGDNGYCPPMLAVWDPMTGCARELYGPEEYLDPADSYKIAVLCAVSGCDHRSCHAVRPFKMVYVGVKTRDGECVALAFVSSPDMGDWTKASDPEREEWEEPCSDLDLANDAFVHSMPAVLVDDALHFLLGYKYDDGRAGILKYSLSSDSLSFIDAPLAMSVVARASILMAMKDGRLGFAHVDRLTLHVWSRQVDSDGGASWTHGRIVDLKSLLHIKYPKSRARLIGSVEGGDIIFVTADLGVYEIDLNTLEWKERRKRENLHALYPYMSFYNPPERVIPGDAAH
ncbi:unnamed protein product [Triticum turgidum subsp. durum]|uniref:F-box domain-containing protein n=1 Tax=Triticum turgidum subsp. durum TaxID=4567 RepID=A0A9R0SPB4_TRITD|nr:unnamed protein product [Triticum turgidum subsp. durum]